MRLILIGPPGAGKGTQLHELARIYNIQMISTGEILRDQIARKTSIGLAVAEQMNSGSYVDDEIVLELVKQRIMSDDCSRGFIFDGFPRTEVQAERLWDILEHNDLSLDKVISLEAPDYVIIDRMSGRLTCPNCGKSYHEKNYPPALENICDICGATLIMRDDDKPETVQKRLEIYRELTEPIINYYRQRDMLLTVDGVGDVNQITRCIVDKLNEKS